jgi:acyl-CoA thioesterase-1
VVFLGDSLSAGYGLAEEDAYPAVVARRMAERGHPIHLVNAGVSGDTTAGGLARVDWVLQQKPAVLVVELGANDGLRGQPLAGIESNLREIVRRGKAAGAKVLLTGMLIPPNYGKQYADGFAAIYPRVAHDENVALLPFLLTGVAAETQLNQADGIHPTVEGAKRVAENVLPYLEKLLAPPGGVASGR